MNEQQGKHLDQHVRQALDSLPNVPAPGTTFDAGKLWEKLRPELATSVVIVPKRTGQVRWLVAASLLGIGLFLNWLWRIEFSADRPQADRRVARYVTTKVPNQPEERTQQKQEVLTLSPKREQQLANRQPQIRHEKILNLAVSIVDKVDSQPTGATTNVPENLPNSDVALTESVAVSPPLAVVDRKAGTTYPKRRFAVVHQNELRADAETRARLERNDRFVQLGRPASPSGTFPVTLTDEKSGLIIPLN